MSDLISIVDLEVRGYIGVTDSERARAQRLHITLDMSVDCIRTAAASDNVAQTINYTTVAQRVRGFVEKRPRNLLETLAEQIAADLLEAYPIQKLTIEIKKFILPDVRFVSVKIERSKN